MFKAKIDYF